jgi:hypothetical protein
MKIEDKLSNQGLRVVDASVVNELKSNYKKVATNFGLRPEGYFIGKSLLNKILKENKDAAGIVISFGFNLPIEKKGKLHLIIEQASGISKVDDPKIIDKLPKYATSATAGGGDPDGATPFIKPKPPM